MSKLRALVIVNKCIVDGPEKTVWREVQRIELRGNVHYDVFADGVDLYAERVRDQEPLNDICLECAQPYAFQAYNVKDEVWKAAGLTKGLMHIWCLEKRLGRRITVDDLSDAKWNDLIKYFVKGP